MNDYDIVEKYEHPGVTKFIHANGMETTLKTVPTCGEDKEKAVLFVSSSVGCDQKCKFCYLTTKKMKYEPVSDETIYNACIEVLKVVDIKDKYLKLSFMGMGDSISEDTDYLMIAFKVFTFMHDSRIARGIDGVDIGTSLPNVPTIARIISINILNYFLEELYKSGFTFNPHNDYSKRSFARVFISLHAETNNKRKVLMPKTSSMRQLNKFVKELEVDTIFHHMVIDGVNDNLLTTSGVFEIANFHDSELRLLRFNACGSTKYKESRNFETIKGLFENSKMKFKYQVSAGSEILASCGQFICKGE